MPKGKRCEWCRARLGPSTGYLLVKMQVEKIKRARFDRRVQKRKIYAIEFRHLCPGKRCLGWALREPSLKERIVSIVG